jgi:hypothetical protein
MKLEQKKIHKTKTELIDLYVPFDQLGSNTVDLYQVFARKLLESGRTIEITRSDLRDATDPMLTDYISDEAMHEMLVDIAMKLDNRDQESIRRQDDFDLAFWRDMESVFVANGVPYISDASLDDFKVGDRVFVKGMTGSTYGTVAELPEVPKIDECVDDCDYTELKVKTDDGKIITADIWETVKEY